jgi:hypothetical protein
LEKLRNADGLESRAAMQAFRAAVTFGLWLIIWFVARRRIV